MNVRCKFACTFKQEFENYTNVSLSAVYQGSPENAEFFKFTPSGQLTFSTVNNAAASQFELGKEYYIDISLAE